MIRLLRRLVYLGIAALGLTIVAVLIATYWAMDRFSPLRDFDQKLDAIVVLSAGIEPDGILGFSSRRRIRTAVLLLQNGATDRLILSGGPIAENVNISRYMFDFAIEIGAPAHAIELEDRSRTTWENLRYSYTLLKRQDYQRIGLLTDASHLPRALVLDAYLGDSSLIPISSLGQFKNSRSQRIGEVVREALAWWYNLGKIVAWEVTGWFGWSEEDRGELIF